MAAAASVSGHDASTLLREAVSHGSHVDVTFGDGAGYRFHSLWLRDACRDADHVSAAAGERILSETPIVQGTSGSIAASALAVGEDSITVSWSDSSVDSTLDSQMLRAYAPVVGQPLSGSGEAGDAVSSADVEWLLPFSGIEGVPAPSAPGQVDLWTGTDGPMDFPRFTHDEIMGSPARNLDLLKDMVRVGACFVDGVPDCGDASSLHAFTDYALGGMQKDPARLEPNWTIMQNEAAASISYNPALRLNNHTDQSLPSHGVPGLVLIMHYAAGSGHNTLTDGYAVAEALRAEDPEAFELLTTYGNEQERDLVASRSDTHGSNSYQTHQQSLLISQRKPILQLDDTNSHVVRLQYNEVFRMPATVPFDVFPKWYAAYQKFATMLHSPDFERQVQMNAGTIMLVQNWRVFHGRAGAQSGDRKLFGGTVTREAVYSRGRQCAQLTSGVKLWGAACLS